MKYFLDTEFIEGFPKRGKWSKKTPKHFIDLISIGIVAEDGREYYAISNEYNYNDASDWVKENVILPLYTSTVHGGARNHFDVKNFHLAYGKANAAIAEDIKGYIFGTDNPMSVQFVGYYADYDWVLFCSLFGTMRNLPAGFPMYCIDLKQTLDTEAEKCLLSNVTNEWERHPIFKSEMINKGIPAFKSAGEVVERIKQNPNYPKQTNEHNALADAKWNFELYKFLNP